MMSPNITWDLEGLIDESVKVIQWHGFWSILLICFCCALAIISTADKGMIILYKAPKRPIEHDDFIWPGKWCQNLRVMGVSTALYIWLWQEVLSWLCSECFTSNFKITFLHLTHLDRITEKPVKLKLAKETHQKSHSVRESSKICQDEMNRKNPAKWIFR